MSESEVCNDRPVAGFRLDLATAVPECKHSVHIRQLNHGYLVTIGCQEFAIEGVSRLLMKLENYLTNPEQVEKEWLAGNYKI
jgi:hypothetical protein